MEFEVGSVLTGKVTAITKFGAFVTFAPGKSGLVHISEIANAYVSNISDFLKEGQDVSVKIISIDEAGRINLSIKQTQESAPRQQRPDKPAFQSAGKPAGRKFAPQYEKSQNQDSSYSRDPSAGIKRPRANYEAVQDKSADNSFEDKLKRFMQDSDNKISGLYADKRTSRRKPR